MRAGGFTGVTVSMYKMCLLTVAVFLFCATQGHAQSKPTEWEKILEAAKKEGKVVASIPPSPELRKLMEIAFSQRYGIATEFVPARGGAIIQRMVSEAKANRQYFDLHIGGTESVITGLLPENVLDPVDPYLILPEVRDPKYWWGGHIYIDNAKKFCTILSLTKQ